MDAIYVQNFTASNLSTKGAPAGVSEGSASHAQTFRYGTESLDGDPALHGRSSASVYDTTAYLTQSASTIEYSSDCSEQELIRRRQAVEEEIRQQLERIGEA